MRLFPGRHVREEELSTAVSIGTVAEGFNSSANPEAVVPGSELTRAMIDQSLGIKHEQSSIQSSEDSFSSNYDFDESAYYSQNATLEFSICSSQYFADSSRIPTSVACSLHITFGGAPNAISSTELELSYTDPTSYQTLESIAQDHAENACAGILVGKQLNFKYGNCTIVGQDVEKSGVPLTTREDWDAVCTILTNYWMNKPQGSFRLDILRDYFSYRSKAISEASFADSKRLELGSLMKRTSSGKRYVPRTSLMRFTSPSNIREIIIQDSRLNLGSEEKEAFIQSVQSKASLVLAMCVLAGLRMTCLKTLLDSGCSDASLPLEDNHCCHPKCRADFDTLVDRQGGFLAARFDTVGEHQNFDNRIVIPLQYWRVDKDEDAFVTKGRANDVEYDRPCAEKDCVKQNACCGQGAYSTVYRVRMDPDHHRLSQNGNADFALKEFKDRPHKGGTDFERELKILNELRRYPHNHIVTHLATWTQDGRYYMLFPYAQCNLRQYMRWSPFGAPTKENFLWLLKQFCGLAEALRDIHNLSGANTSSFATSLTPQPEMRKSGWHHDLKPENILFFKSIEYGRGTFQISDFGSGKIHTYRSDSDKTQSPNGTLTYEPPEARSEGLTSRPYDIWSLGCVFLELLIWAVVDIESVEKFASQRVGRRYPDSRIDIVTDDAFWQMAEDGKATLRDSVDGWIRILKVRIPQQRLRPFKEVLELVIRMLDPNRRTRIMALYLSDALDNIYKQTKLDLSKSDLAEYGRIYKPLNRSFIDPNESYLPSPRPDTSPFSTWNTGYANEDYLTVSSVENFSSLYSPGQYRRNSYGSPASQLSRDHSFASSNVSIRGQQGSMDEES